MGGGPFCCLKPLPDSLVPAFSSGRHGTGGLPAPSLYWRTEQRYSLGVSFITCLNCRENAAALE